MRQYYFNFFIIAPLKWGFKVQTALVWLFKITGDISMKDQHEKIKGYRDLSQEEIDLMNEIKESASKVEELVQKLNHFEGSQSLTAPDGTTKPSPRWLNEGWMDLQKGFMSLVRSVAKPTSF